MADQRAVGGGAELFLFVPHVKIIAGVNVKVVIKVDVKVVVKVNVKLDDKVDDKVYVKDIAVVTVVAVVVMMPTTIQLKMQQAPT